MVKLLLRYSFLLSISILLSCKKLSPGIETPSYIYIPSYQILYKSTYANGGPGSASHKFTDVNVTVNGQAYGVYPVPCKIPVLTSGSASVKIRPVIKVNGVSAARSEYQPMESFDTTMNLEAGKVNELIPTFDYYANGVTFYWVEDFEFSSSGSSLIGDSAIHYELADKFEGTRSARIELRNGQSSSLSYSSTMLHLPTGIEAVYLEVNFKCNQPFNVGLLDANKNSVGGSSAGGGNKTNGEWNKVYIYLTPVTSRTPLPAYYVYFYFDNKDFVDDGTMGPNPVLLIDNIKVVSQP